ncbi:MAG: hypothetical protein GX660_24265, partial [Clostridiaceae bacterium]|nr:hypothetical protein [Clostridiaceae bacterium]
MKSERLLNMLGQVNDEYIEEAAPSKQTVKNRVWIKGCAIAACVILVLTIGVSLIDRQRKGISISDASKKATFKFVEGVSDNTSLTKSSLVWHSEEELLGCSEEELFSKWKPVIIKGTVSRISNIEINFNGDKEYRAIAEIEVGKVYRGNIQLGDLLSVLLPCPIDTAIKVEDTGIISQIQVGSTGIFMPMEYNESS